MNDEMSGLGERLVTPALITDKGSVPCMGAFVSGEIAGLGERPVTSVMVTDKESATCAGS
ncbi:hypothetical protein [Sansalvadorimonas verongulae]|uniref:hypothetical protein n=1 Tax=Sansalvadorimonas verongulae TaxID=2172824 RepID=UPI0012BD4C65|nr:hypothetical protein [Sansalvadorimonas verongulae]MTI11894.1 hypothetical protein [Sansalvadorimonas verongulae]